METTTKNKRIKQIRKEFCNDSTGVFASTIGKSPEFCTNLFRDGYSVGEKTINLICEKFPVNKNWIITGEGQITKENNKQNKQSLFEENLLQKILVQIEKQNEIIRDQNSTIKSQNELLAQQITTKDNQIEFCMKHIDNLTDRNNAREKVGNQFDELLKRMKEVLAQMEQDHK